ncbi:succinyl-diaminopimelate desuccinylase [Parvibaculum lavamentivorans DS-1]|uniref:Succinyl-diaminopimelate desuccinylase n=1 Tax=Parvibaculum lavamentivorans (strain DS-1 / DSM 13023 / NCIMB 13966) TaxID=402881 RepID=DAPE_PARL1|nr:succinyl-diaminopimelate desuccinylase [Parvibaculum lavamentivorans]A7HPQ6.1 RecName: Full=Succinyl-diaminopimelate desuccinylase; Short=SDAP desuccinylase; AltName: Full=N-succinyl-LL-2,6-diaminoheptanedioate amidohydrolase [Parvibaculum lavamentivorans DS-1]ABS61889.1 succinyl-diaminopimelate desuccinylase [Parvibaculum lavamentivorans DS-1]
MTAPASSPASPYDPLDIAVELIRCPSVTPDEGGALGVLEKWLAPLGFKCERMRFSAEGTPDVDNLYARLGSGHPHFCFAGHTDVVPVGQADAWSVDPFAADIKDGRLYGRGAADMKSAVASFVAAAERISREGFQGSISLLITGDEEGPSINGTRKMLEKLAARNETIDHCIVGEPTSVEKLGDMIKVGRRGSINGWLTVQGTQGHVAYPHLADNPVPRLLEMLRRLDAHVLDEGTDHFQPSNLEVTTVDIGNTATNVIPGSARATVNIRFNDLHTGASLDKWMRGVLDAVTAEMGGSYSFKTSVSGEAFITEPGAFSALIAEAAKEVTGITPELSTTGGTSDARFIRAYAPVVEIGLPNATMHKADENTGVSEIRQLADIYETVLRGYFAGRAS